MWAMNSWHSHSATSFGSGRGCTYSFWPSLQKAELLLFLMYDSTLHLSYSTIYRHLFLWTTTPSSPPHHICMVVHSHELTWWLWATHAHTQLHVYVCMCCIVYVTNFSVIDQKFCQSWSTIWNCKCRTTSRMAYGWGWIEGAHTYIHSEWVSEGMSDTTQQVKPELTSQCSLYAERNEAMSFSDTSEGCNRKTTKHCQCHHVSHCVYGHTQRRSKQSNNIMGGCVIKSSRLT